MNKKLIRFTKSSAYWSNKKEEKKFSVDCKTLIRMVDWLIDNTFVVVGDKVFQQKIGIPMGTDCAPFLANLFLFAYEFKWMYKMLKDRKFEVLNHFRIVVDTSTTYLVLIMILFLRNIKSPFIPLS